MRVSFRLVPTFFLVITSVLGAEVPPPLALSRAQGPISVDGDLGDAGWNGAAVIDRFYETSPADNAEPKVRTVARITFDALYFYIALEAFDPSPSTIRAPFVDRDNVFGTDDNFAIFLDTRGDRKTAIELRVNPRGIQGDAIFNDANGREDFSPDFFYDTAARITSTGWQAEMRIPFSSLRYSEEESQTWNILVWRNYPREFRYFIQSAPIPRGSNCYMCFLHPLTGLTGLPRSGHLVAAPYVTASSAQRREGGDYESEPVRSEVGADIKWNPDADTTVDATLNPDFSQIESDVAQISVNERFALFFPEKRPFFLESADLFDTPIQAAYTRTITAPRWGLRATGKLGPTTGYTFLASEDRGGGLIVLPGSQGSDFAPQDFRSFAAIGRIRKDIGPSFGSLLFTDREYYGGGHNRVIGPDFQWRPSETTTVTGQLLVSETRDPDFAGTGSGNDSEISHAGQISWSRQSRSYDTFVQYTDFGDEFRADNGFVPQDGFRGGYAEAGYKWYPSGRIRFLRGYVVAEEVQDSQGEQISRSLYPAVFFQGVRNLTGGVQLRLGERVAVGPKQLDFNQIRGFVQIDPSRRFPRVGINYSIGDSVDFSQGRVGEGAGIGLFGTVRPHPRLELILNLNRQWLDLDRGEQQGRLFTARVERLKATYSFSAKSLVRAIGQHVSTERDPLLYQSDVPRRSGGFLGTILYSYKLNWQTVFFAGYGDSSVLSESDDLTGTDRSVFVKVSYAIQR